MSIETVELNAIAEVAMSKEQIEMLALDLDDLDLVAGGCTLGSLS